MGLGGNKIQRQPKLWGSSKGYTGYVDNINATNARNNPALFAPGTAAPAQIPHNYNAFDSIANSIKHNRTMSDPTDHSDAYGTADNEMAPVPAPAGDPLGDIMHGNNLDDGWKNTQPGALPKKAIAKKTGTVPISPNPYGKEGVKAKAPGATKTVTKRKPGPKKGSHNQMVQMTRTTSGNPFAKNFGGWGQLFQGNKTEKVGAPISRTEYNKKTAASQGRSAALNKVAKSRMTPEESKILDLF